MTARRSPPRPANSTAPSPPAPRCASASSIGATAAASGALPPLAIQPAIPLMMSGRPAHVGLSGRDAAERRKAGFGIHRLQPREGAVGGEAQARRLAGGGADARGERPVE